MLYEVVSPVADPGVQRARGAPRLDNLNGKTVCEISLTKYRGDQTFPIIRQALRERYPDIKIIPYTDLPFNESPMWQGVRKEETAAAYRDAFEKFGVDAVISGNGG